MVAICHNMDLGDAWEWADQPELSGEVRVDGVPNRNQLHNLRDDALMFEFFFKYPIAAFANGDSFSWAGGRCGFSESLLLDRRRCFRLAACCAIAASTPDRCVVWASNRNARLLLLMLWQPALSVATLRPQQNIVAVVVDDSQSMSLADRRRVRRDVVLQTLELNQRSRQEISSETLSCGSGLERIGFTESAHRASSGDPPWRRAQAGYSEAASLPIGAVVLLSDGADNSGGIDLPTISEIRRHRIPIHTVGIRPGETRARH